jgi:hypothetical protein
MIARILAIVFVSICSCHSSVQNGTELTSVYTKDSATTVFFPDGYYFPNANLQFKDLSLDWMEIETKPSQNIFIYFRFRTSLDSLINITADSIILNGKSLFVYINHQKLSGFTLKGAFLGQKGPSLDKVSEHTIVLKGTIAFDGKVNPVNMTWFEGD